MSLSHSWNSTVQSTSLSSPGTFGPKVYEVRVEAGTEKHATQDTEDFTKSDEREEYSHVRHGD